MPDIDKEIVQPGPTSPEALEEQRFLPSGDEAGSAPEDRPFRPDVEGLRAIAILLVVLFHAGIPQLRGGFFGVDVFFVISGFVITGLLLRERRATERTKFIAFYARRARRILPAAILVILVSVIVTRLMVGARDAVLVGSDSRWAALFVGNFHFSSVFPNFLVKRPSSPLENYWSLAVEEQFYLIYPALLVAVVSIPGRWSFRTRLVVGLTCVVIVSFLVSVGTSKVGQLAPYNSSLTRAWELALGALVAVSTARLERLPRAFAAAITWIGLAVIGIAAYSVSLRTALPGSVTAVPVVGAALVIAGGAASPPAWGAESVLRLLPFRWLGRWSYSWYLWHWPVLVLVAEHAHTSVTATSVSKNLVLVMIALGLAVATYFLVENPVRHSKRLARNPGITLAGGGLLVASCVAVTFAF